MRRTAPIVAPLVAALALLVLAGSVTVAVVAISRANDRVTHARGLVIEFADLQDAVAAEAFAEAAYRRAPSEETWQRLETALDAVPPVIADLRRRVGRTDGFMLSHLAILNARYGAQVRATRDTTVSRRDDRVAGPALDSMNDLLGSTIDRHRTAAVRATEQQADLIRRLGLLLPAAFAIALALLGWVFRLTLREQRRLRHEAAANKEMALTDALTGLPNRAALLGTMSAALGQPGTRAALLFLDLDRFKPINDTFGHQAGDEVLQEVARRLQDAVRSGDLAARLGGDEFAVFLTRGGDAEAVAQRILAAFEPPVTVEGRPVDVGTSIGIAVSEAGQAAEELLRAADEALYLAKTGGRGRAMLAGG